MLYEFHDRLFLEYRSMWFLWEPAWEQFRPIESVQWDGDRFEIDDRVYCSDPSSSVYGYGSEKMRELCELLKPWYDRPAAKVDLLPMPDTEWLRDRRVSLTICAPRDIQTWKKLVQRKPRTCRKAPRGKKFTRRTL